MVFAFALFLGLDQGHKSVQSLLANEQPAIVTPAPVVTPLPSIVPVLSNVTPNREIPLEKVAKVTGDVLQWGAMQGVEWTVAIFDQLLN